MRFLALLIALIAASAAIASVPHGRHAGQDGRDIELIASVKKFGIKGVPVSGLFPGATSPLRIKITNKYPFSIRMAAPKGKVAAATTRAGCTGIAANLGVSSTGNRRLVIARHKSKVVVLQVAMPTTVANACQGATFKISLSARATRA
jgi:hypothetical protein